MIPLPIPLPIPWRLAARLASLQGRVLRLELKEIGFGPQFTLGAFGLKPAFGKPDVTIRASVADYLALALRREDPDTLFFSRRLVIEGETELGLVVKNALDSADW
ncbi:MAG: SCP2 sterol-binding domain-containing protein [Betaproteobacteria bacterium]|nr:SCP2 sterol-binding domain-containing protein [Betaproteobacteria bacterium]